MTGEQWGSIFSRMELTWGEISPHRRNYYFELLADLDGGAVADAVERLSMEAREFVPPPGVIRDYASRAARTPTLSAAPPAPTIPAPTPTPPGAIAPTVAPAATPIVVRRSSGKAVASLVLGLASVAFGWLLLVTPILAIIFGAIGLSEMKDDPTLGGRGQALWGLWLGIATLALWLAVFVIAGITGDGN